MTKHAKNHPWNREANARRRRAVNSIIGWLPTFSAVDVGVYFYVDSLRVMPHYFNKLVDNIGVALGREFIYVQSPKNRYIKVMRVG